MSRSAARQREFVSPATRRGQVLRLVIGSVVYLAATAVVYVSAYANGFSEAWTYLLVLFLVFITIEAHEMFDTKPEARRLATRPAGPEAESHRQRLEQTLESVSYAIAHDLRAPLRAIHGFCKLLVDDVGSALSPAASRDLAGIQEGVERIHALTERWLGFAAREARGIVRERIDLSECARAIHRGLQASEPRRAVIMTIEPNLTAYADATLAKELLQNLIGNAWKFTQHNSTSAQIEFGAKNRADEIHYFVRDNGIGFTDAEAGSLFQPFRRLHSPERYPGTGIGLVIALRIVELHGGRIWADSQGGGATIWFTLPEGNAANG